MMGKKGIGREGEDLFVYSEHLLTSLIKFLHANIQQIYASPYLFSVEGKGDGGGGT
jgi:hypothetical protein